MKRNKIAVVALLVLTNTIALFAFTSKSTHKTVNVKYYYIGEHKFIGCGNPNSLVYSEVTDVSNWTTTAPAYDCDNGNYLCAITFEIEPTSDGGNDGQLTWQEAIDALWNYFNSGCTLPAHHNCFTVGSGPGAIVCVYRKSTND